MQALCRAVEVFLFGCDDEIAQVPQFHVGLG